MKQLFICLSLLLALSSCHSQSLEDRENMKVELASVENYSTTPHFLVDLPVHNSTYTNVSSLNKKVKSVKVDKTVGYIIVNKVTYEVHEGKNGGLYRFAINGNTLQLDKRYLTPSQKLSIRQVR